MKNLILLAWRELTIRPLRSLVNVLAVALGVAMVLAADVIGSAARSGTMVADERNLGAVLGELVTLSLTVVSVIILLAAAFLIFNNFAMQITQRRRRIGGMRAAGMTRRQVTVWVMLEASLVAWIGVGLGFIAGPLMGQGIIRLIELLGEATGMTVLVFAQPDPIRSAMIQAACLGWGVALAASLIPAVQAARLTPLEGLRRPAYSVRTKLKNRITYLCLLAIIGVTGWVLIWPPGEWTRPPWNGYFGLGLVILWLALLAVISPWLVGKLGIWGRSAAADLSSGVSRLIPDNLWRARGRVAVTALTIALGLAMIIGVTGFMSFTMGTVLHGITADALSRGGFVILPVDLEDSVNVIAAFDPDVVFVPPQMLEEIDQITQGVATPLSLYMANPEELSVVPGMLSYVLDFQAVRRSDLFTFTQGGWEEAAPIMTSGCGLLLSPSVAARNQVGIGDTLAVSGSTSRVDCVVAGIGNFAFANISIISLAAGDDFNVGGAGGVYITPNSGADQDALRNDLEAVVDRYPGTTFNELSAAGKIVGVFDRTRVMTNALLLLTCLAAGLGVVSTTVASLEERRRELALMRAVGADDRQLTRLVVGEAGVIGLFGGVLGLAAGLGGTFIFILAAGASNWGLYDLPLWPAAVEAGSEALKAGVFGLLIGPGVSVLAAWIPARAFLRDDLLRWLQAD